MVKRLVDILGSLAGIVLFSLPMLAIAVWVRMDSPGPAIFRQRRAGWRGKPFEMLKFRTMRTGGDPYGNSPHGGDDPRLTRSGKFLREKSLDELPQFFNVLLGQMSLVGPRPLYERQAEQWDARQRKRLDVRPGLTGYAQVYGRGGITIEEKIELDLYYVEHQSLLLDLTILLKTATNVVRGSGDVYERQYSRDQEREEHKS